MGSLVLGASFYLAVHPVQALRLTKKVKSPATEFFDIATPKAKDRKKVDFCSAAAAGVELEEEAEAEDPWTSSNRKSKNKAATSPTWWASGGVPMSALLSEVDQYQTEQQQAGSTASVNGGAVRKGKHQHRKGRGSRSTNIKNIHRHAAPQGEQQRGEPTPPLAVIRSLLFPGGSGSGSSSGVLLPAGSSGSSIGPPPLRGSGTPSPTTAVVRNVVENLELDDQESAPPDERRVRHKRGRASGRQKQKKDKRRGGTTSTGNGVCGADESSSSAVGGTRVFLVEDLERQLQKSCVVTTKAKAENEKAQQKPDDPAFQIDRQEHSFFAASPPSAGDDHSVGRFWIMNGATAAHPALPYNYEGHQFDEGSFPLVPGQLQEPLLPQQEAPPVQQTGAEAELLLHQRHDPVASNLERVEVFNNSAGQDVDDPAVAFFQLIMQQRGTSDKPAAGINFDDAKQMETEHLPQNGLLLRFACSLEPIVAAQVQHPAHQDAQLAQQQEQLAAASAKKMRIPIELCPILNSTNASSRTAAAAQHCATPNMMAAASDQHLHLQQEVQEQMMEEVQRQQQLLQLQQSYHAAQQAGTTAVQSTSHQYPFPIPAKQVVVGYRLEVFGLAAHNRDAVMAAVRQNGMALAFAAPNLRDSSDIVRVAVAQNPMSLKFASAPRRADMEILLPAIQRCPDVLEFVHWAGLLTEVSFFLVQKAVAINGMALRFAPPECRISQKISDLAVAQNPEAIRYVAKPHHVAPPEEVSSFTHPPLESSIQQPLPPSLALPSSAVPVLSGVLESETPDAPYVESKRSVDVPYPPPGENEDLPKRSIFELDDAFNDSSLIPVVRPSVDANASPMYVRLPKDQEDTLMLNASMLLERGASSFVGHKGNGTTIGGGQLQVGETESRTGIYAYDHSGCPLLPPPPPAEPPNLGHLEKDLEKSTGCFQEPPSFSTSSQQGAFIPRQVVDEKSNASDSTLARGAAHITVKLARQVRVREVEQDLLDTTQTTKADDEYTASARAEKDVEMEDQPRQSGNEEEIEMEYDHKVREQHEDPSENTSGSGLNPHSKAFIPFALVQHRQNEDSTATLANTLGGAGTGDARGVEESSLGRYLAGLTSRCASPWLENGYQDYNSEIPSAALVAGPPSNPGTTVLGTVPTQSLPKSSPSTSGSTGHLPHSSSVEGGGGGGQPQEGEQVEAQAEQDVDEYQLQQVQELDAEGRTPPSTSGRVEQEHHPATRESASSPPSKPFLATSIALTRSPLSLGPRGSTGGTILLDNAGSGYSPLLVYDPESGVLEEDPTRLASPTMHGGRRGLPLVTLLPPGRWSGQGGLRSSHPIAPAPSSSGMGASAASTMGASTLPETSGVKAQTASTTSRPVAEEEHEVDLLVPNGRDNRNRRASSDDEAIELANYLPDVDQTRRIDLPCEDVQQDELEEEDVGDFGFAGEHRANADNLLTRQDVEKNITTVAGGTDHVDTLINDDHKDSALDEPSLVADSSNSSPPVVLEDHERKRLAEPQAVRASDLFSPSSRTIVDELNSEAGAEDGCNFGSSPSRSPPFIEEEGPARETFIGLKGSLEAVTGVGDPDVVSKTAVVGVDDEEPLSAERFPIINMKDNMIATAYSHKKVVELSCPSLSDKKREWREQEVRVEAEASKASSGRGASSSSKGHNKSSPEAEQEDAEYGSQDKATKILQALLGAGSEIEEEVGGRE
ncbi:unnamed protein product [Amoebophrya sp. A25]|nr:unnamed protein product [Amoebophrya sp. A25]|eukprot:GSA25T00021933001.1